VASSDSNSELDNVTGPSSVYIKKRVVKKVTTVVNDKIRKENKVSSIFHESDDGHLNEYGDYDDENEFDHIEIASYEEIEQILMQQKQSQPRIGQVSFIVIDRKSERCIFYIILLMR